MNTANTSTETALQRLEALRAAGGFPDMESLVSVLETCYEQTLAQEVDEYVHLQQGTKPDYSLALRDTNYLITKSWPLLWRQWKEAQ